MYHDSSYGPILAAASRAAWRIEEVLPENVALDFGCNFMPENLARTAELDGLSAAEKRTLNQIRGHEYLTIFGLVEEFILPFVLDHARPHLRGDDARVRALLNFAGEEAKHIELFKRFQGRFISGFGTDCAVIGPPESVAAEVLRHDALSVALVILQIEWMTQRHYLDSVRDDTGLDPLFKSLLKHHWMEEASHARLDRLMVEALAAGRDEAGIQAAIDGYLEIGLFLDNGLGAQAGFNLDAFEQATGRNLTEAEREALLQQQHQALRWTYLGSGMTHPEFVATLESLSARAAERVAEVAPAFS
jgi:hypothetical protein